MKYNEELAQAIIGFFVIAFIFALACYIQSSEIY